MIGGGITTAQDMIGNAYAMVTLALRFCEGCEAGIIKPEFCNRQIKIDTGGPGLTLSPQTFTTEKLIDVSYNLFLGAIGLTAIIVDQALDQKYGRKDPLDQSNLGSIRSIIYQIRNAFAHEPQNPSWLIRGDYLRIYEIDIKGLNLTFDAQSLNGKKLVPKHYGGFEGYFAMLKYCYDQVSRHDNGTS